MAVKPKTPIPAPAKSFVHDTTATAADAFYNKSRRASAGGVRTSRAPVSSSSNKRPK